jgi:hypothetical protein
VKSEWTTNVSEGNAMPWVDDFTCARVPDRAVLCQFKWLLLAKDARKLAGVAKHAATVATASAAPVPDAHPELNDAYAYLKDTPDDKLVVHPDLVHDGGDALRCPNRALRRLIELSTGEGQQLAGCTARVDSDETRNASTQTAPSCTSSSRAIRRPTRPTPTTPTSAARPGTCTTACETSTAPTTATTPK